jgi:rubrerythrin
MAEYKSQKDIMKRLREQEKVLSKMYKIYAKRFPEHHDFWMELAAEEKQHAVWIQELGKKVKQGKIEFEDNRFDIQEVEKSLHFVNSQMDKAKNENMTLLNALSMSLAIEKAMIESHFFYVFDGDSDEIRETLQKLLEDTKQHAAKIEQAWKEQARLKGSGK